MKKRIISLLLTVAMLLSVIPVLANADAAVTEPSFKSVSLTLDGILRLNVKVNPGTVTDMSGYKVKFTVGEDAPVECTEPTQQNGLYVYTAKIPAHKLQKAVKVELLNAESEVLGESTWTLDAYLDSIVEWDAGLNKLADALELYATNAAAYAANTESTAPATAVEQATLADYQIEKETPDATVIPTAKLLLNDACTIRVQVSASNWVEGYSLKINGESKDLEYNETSGLYYYDIKDIRAQGWGTKYAVELVDGEGETLYKCNYAVMSYAYAVLGMPENYAKEINLLKSMYLYFAEADNYIKAERYEYSLTYNANYAGSSETVVDSASVTADNKNFTVAANSFDRPGYKFNGWNTKADGTGTAYAVGDTVALPVYNTVTAVDLGDSTTSRDGWRHLNNGSYKTTNSQHDTSAWVVSDGVMACNISSNNQVLYIQQLNEINYELSTKVVMQAGGSIGLIFGGDQYFRVWMNGSGEYRLIAGTATSNYKYLGKYATTDTVGAPKGHGLKAGEEATLTLKVEGNKFSVYVNGIYWASATTEKTSLTGWVGLFQLGASGDGFGFKDFRVAKIG